MINYIESGTWCEKYNNWVQEDTIQQCKEDGGYLEKGCASCKFCSYAVKEKEITWGRDSCVA